MRAASESMPLLESPDNLSLSGIKQLAAAPFLLSCIGSMSQTRTEASRPNSPEEKDNSDIL